MTESKKVSCFSYNVSLSDNDKQTALQAGLDALTTAVASSITYTEIRVGSIIRVTVTYTSQTPN